MENDSDEGEGVDALRKHGPEDGVGAADLDFGRGLVRVSAGEEDAEAGACETAGALRDGVADGVFEFDHVHKEDSESDGGVDVGAGDVAEGEDDDREREADGEGSEVAELAVADDDVVADGGFGEENCQNEDEGGSTFNEILKLIR